MHEPPEWYRVFGLARYDEPDAQEQAMINGSLAPAELWPAELHEWHARRRWAVAQSEYELAHPDFAEQLFEAIVNASARDFMRR